MHGQGGQADLGAVVEVALDPAQLGGGVVHGQGAGVLEVADAPGEPAGAEQGHQQPAVGRDHRPGHPGRGQHHAQADGQGEEGAGKVATWSRRPGNGVATGTGSRVTPGGWLRNRPHQNG